MNEPKAQLKDPKSTPALTLKKFDFKQIDLRFLLKRMMPHLAAGAFFLTLVLVYFSPSIFEDKVLRQGDMIQYEGMINDMREAAQDAKPGEVIAWSGALYGGMPNYLTYTHGLAGNYIGYLDRWIKSVDYMGGSIILASLLSFYALMIVFGASPIIATLAAVGFAFSSYHFVIIEAGHITKGYVIAYMPLTLAGMWLTYKQKWSEGFLFFLLGITLSLGNHHPQITYYLALFCLFPFAAIVIEKVKEKQFTSLSKITGLFALATILAIGPNLGIMYAQWELGKSTLRGPSELTITPSGQTTDAPEQGLDKDYAFMWSYGKAELLTWLVPNAYGGKSGGYVDQDSRLYQELRRRGAEVGEQVQTYTYWGDKPFTSGPHYFGAGIFFLFILGLILWKHPFKWWIVAGGGFLTLLSFGKNLDGFNAFMFEHLPLYNKFRAVEMAQVIPGFVVAFIAGLGLHQFINSSNPTGHMQDAQLVPLQTDQLKKGLYISLGITVGILAIVIFLPELLLSFRSPLDAQYNLPDWYYAALVQDRKALAQDDAIRSLIIVLIMFACLFAYVWLKQKEETGKKGSSKKAKKQSANTPAKPSTAHTALQLIPFVLVAVVLIDMWDVNQRYLNDSNYSIELPQDTYKPSLADEIILQDQELGFRVLNLNGTFSDNQTPYFHRSVGGYHPAKLRRTQELIDFYMQDEINQIIRSLQTTGSLEAVNLVLQNTKILNMLNTKYIIYNPDQPPIQNPYAYGPAWFVQDVNIVESANEEILALCETDLTRTAVVHTSFMGNLDSPLQADESGSVELIDYKPHHFIYSVSTTTPQLLVLSEVFYEKGWEVFINGEPAELFRANWNIMGLKVKGNQRIELQFRPDMLISMGRISSIISLIVTGIIYSLIIVIIIKLCR